MRILIAGGGQTAALVAARLIKEGNGIVIVEQNPERCEELEEMLDARIIEGNVTSINTLRKAGIADAEMLIALTDNDYINVLFCLIASVESNAKVRLVRLRTHEVAHWKRIFQESGAMRLDRPSYGQKTDRIAKSNRIRHGYIRGRP